MLVFEQGFALKDAFGNHNLVGVEAQLTCDPSAHLYASRDWGVHSLTVVAAVATVQRPVLISIGDSAFQTFQAPFLQLQVECACSRLEVISDFAFATLEFNSTSKISFSNLVRLRSIGFAAFIAKGTNTLQRHAVEFTGTVPLLTKIGANAFKYVLSLSFSLSRSCALS